MGLNLGGILGGIVRTGVRGAVGFLTGGPAGAAVGVASGIAGEISRGRGSGNVPGATIAMPGSFTGIGEQPGGWQVGGFPVPFPGGGSTQFPVPVRSPSYPSTGFGPAMPGPSPGAGPSLKGADLLGPRLFPATSAQMVGRYAHIPGYALVELPWDLGQYKAGTKMYMDKDDARRLGLYKKRPRPFLTHADVKKVKEADRIKRKIVTLTRRHTDYRVTSAIAAARQSALKSKTKGR